MSRSILRQRNLHPRIYYRYSCCKNSPHLLNLIELPYNHWNKKNWDTISWLTCQNFLRPNFTSRYASMMRDILARIWNNYKLKWQLHNTSLEDVLVLNGTSGFANVNSIKFIRKKTVHVLKDWASHFRPEVAFMFFLFRWLQNTMSSRASHAAIWNCTHTLLGYLQPDKTSWKQIRTVRCIVWCRQNVRDGAYRCTVGCDEMNLRKHTHLYPLIVIIWNRCPCAHPRYSPINWINIIWANFFVTT